MTRLINEPAAFADEAIAGFVAAHAAHVQAVHGGVVRATTSSPGQVAVVLGGGSGHYPAFAGWVGPGMAHGAVCGNIFASPSASQAYSVVKAAHNGGGVLLGFGNYAGDVLHFGQAAERLRAEGIDVRILIVTDDIASSPATERERRRGIAGDLVVFKIVGAAAEAGLDLDAVERIGRKANDATRTYGVAFDGCTLPGAGHPLFTVPEGQMAVGLGIHGEPGVDERPLPTADELADLLVDGLLAEAPPLRQEPGGFTGRVAVLLNSLGTVTHEELFVVYRRVAHALAGAGLTVVAPEAGGHVTSLDMAGVSLTLTFLDAELEQYWVAPADTPALRRGVVSERPRRSDLSTDDTVDLVQPGSGESQQAAAALAEALRVTRDVVLANEVRLGDIDAVAGDGDHGIGMARGARAAVDAAQRALAQHAGAKTLLTHAGAAWAERAGGTSGALWGAALTALGAVLGDERTVDGPTVVRGVRAAVDAVTRLGGAVPGDKTLVDAAVPFVETLESAADTGASLPEAWVLAAQAAGKAAEATADIPARLGRARTHGDRSIGVPDAGAISFALIVSAVSAVFTPNELREKP